jgi:hypothetical protein
LAVFEEGVGAIGNIHLHLADRMPPAFDGALVLSASFGGEPIELTDGEDRCSVGAPVITLTLSDTSGVPDGLAGAPKEMTLTRPPGGTELSSDHVVASGDDWVRVFYPVTVEGTYKFEAVDYARNRNSIEFKLVNRGTDDSGGSGSGDSGGSGGSGGSGSIDINISNQNNQYNYNNAGSSGGGSSGGGSSETTTTSDSYNSQTTTTTNNYYTEQAEARAPATEPETVTTTKKKTPDRTYFRFFNGKTYSNTSGKITPSKYMTEKEFRDADLDDVILESWSESEGEAGTSGQSLTKRDLLEAVEAEAEA